MPKLAVVAAGQPLPEPPYPFDTRSRDWRFTMDLERVWQSDTWAVCPPDIRPWLLMMWAESWRCTPCGSYPNEDDIIAARLGMPINLFRAHREILLRGWSLHSDGRLYHAVISEKVLDMIAWRSAEQERKAKWRAAKALLKNQSHGEDVPRDKTGTDVSLTTPSPSPSPSPSPVGKDEQATPASGSGEPPPCPHQLLIKAFNATLPTCPQVDPDRWNERKQRLMRQRWREAWEVEGKKGRQRDTAALQQWFERLFAYCRQSAFLMGKIPGRDGGPPFELTLEWLLGPKNFDRIIAGDFHREAGRK